MRYYFMHIPKTAGQWLKLSMGGASSTTPVIQAALHGSRYSHIDPAVRTHPTAQEICDLLHPLDRPAFRLFTIVRNPYDRTYSLWKHLRQKNCPPGESLDAPEIFSDFVRELSAGAYADSRFLWPQTRYLDGCDSVILFSFERLSRLKQFLRGNGVLVRDEIVNASPGPHYKTVYDNYTARMVRDLFIDDFKALGYSEDLN